MRRVYGFLAVLFFLLLSACTRVPATLSRDELVVAVRDTSPFVQEEGGGFERDLVELFAQELGLRLRVISVRDQSELLALLREGKAHFAASPNILDGFEDIRYTQPLREAQHLIVQSADAMDVADVQALVGREVEVLEGSPQATLLKMMNVKQSLQAAANARDTAAVRVLVAEQRGLTGVDLLERVSEGKSELAAVDSVDFALASAFFPNLQVAQTLAGPLRFAWAFPVNGDPALYEKAQQFIARVKTEGTLARLNDRYYGHMHRLDPHSISWFLQRVTSTLPRYRAEFVSAQAVTGIDWRLLAALAYQESMWDPLATSPTNVRGMMMLTEETADRLNVSNRLDPRQSIRAGARYLNEIIDGLPAEIPQPDRTWMGIAAYNLGQGHMNGALQIAKTMKRDTTSWYEMKQVLPLMAKPEYYQRLKSGRARGGEAVIMVENIRKFYDILSRFESEEGQNLRFDRRSLNTLAGFNRMQASAKNDPDKQDAGPKLIRATQLLSQR